MIFENDFDSMRRVITQFFEGAEHTVDAKLKQVTREDKCLLHPLSVYCIIPSSKSHLLDAKVVREFTRGNTEERKHLYC